MRPLRSLPAATARGYRSPHRRAPPSGCAAYLAMGPPTTLQARVVHPSRHRHTATKRPTSIPPDAPTGTARPSTAAHRFQHRHRRHARGSCPSSRLRSACAAAMFASSPASVKHDPDQVSGAATACTWTSVPKHRAVSYRRCRTSRARTSSAPIRVHHVRDTGSNWTTGQSSCRCSSKTVGSAGAATAVTSTSHRPELEVDIMLQTVSGATDNGLWPGCSRRTTDLRDLWSADRGMLSRCAYRQRCDVDPCAGHWSPDLVVKPTSPKPPSVEEETLA